MFRNILIIFLILTVAFLGYTDFFRPKSAALPYCQVSSLSTSATPEGAAGSVYITFRISNISSKTCLVRGDQFIQPAYDQSQVKNLNIIDAGLPSVDTFTLAPKSSLYALMHYPNGPQCNGPFIPVPITFSYQISPSDTIAFPLFSPTQAFTIPSCKSVSQLTDIAISNLTNIAPGK